MKLDFLFTPRSQHPGERPAPQLRNAKVEPQDRPPQDHFSHGFEQHPNWLHKATQLKALGQRHNRDTSRRQPSRGSQPPQASQDRDPLTPDTQAVRGQEYMSADCISDQEMNRLFGSDGATLKSLAEAHSDITLGSLMELRGLGMDQVDEATELLSQRPDLGLEDIIHHDGNGAAEVVPVAYNPSSRDMLEHGKMLPSELESMSEQFRHTYGSEAGKAFSKAAQLLSYRSDLSADILTCDARALKSGSALDLYARFADQSEVCDVDNAFYL